MKNDVVELYCNKTEDSSVDWSLVAKNQHCTLLGKKCLKNRKSEPEKTIGSCVVRHSDKEVLICPHRLIENKAIFKDCFHLLTKHEPGNEYHLVSEIGTQAGNVDYMLASVKRGKVVDFVGIELQTMDTTGTVYPYRERFLSSVGVPGGNPSDLKSDKPFGINWKMTAKTILVQLHHKVGLFEAFNKTLVLVLQDHLFDYMKSNFSFSHLEQASVGDAMHFHSYSYGNSAASSSIQLKERLSTDADGVGVCLGLNVTMSTDLQSLLSKIQSKISEDTLVTI